MLCVLVRWMRLVVWGSLGVLLSSVMIGVSLMCGDFFVV